MPWRPGAGWSPVASTTATRPTTVTSQAAHTRIGCRSAARPASRAASALALGVPEDADQLAHGVGRAPELGLLVVGQVDLDDLLEPLRAELAGNAHEDPVEPVLALEERGARQD